MWSDRRLPGVAYAASGVGGAWFLGEAAEQVLGESPRPLQRGGGRQCRTGPLGGGRGGPGPISSPVIWLRPARAVTSLVGRDPPRWTRRRSRARSSSRWPRTCPTRWWAGGVGTGSPARPARLAHRAANTLDAMVGHRTARYRRFGWASARLDDLLDWPAARVTARPGRGGLPAPPCRRRCGGPVARTRPAHPSPNAGVAEAAFAAALGLRLGGINRYGGRVEELRPSARASGAAPAAADIARAVALVRRGPRVLEVGARRDCGVSAGRGAASSATVPHGEPAGAGEHGGDGRLVAAVARPRSRRGAGPVGQPEPVRPGSDARLAPASRGRASSGGTPTRPSSAGPPPRLAARHGCRARTRSC